MKKYLWGALIFGLGIFGYFLYTTHQATPAAAPSVVKKSYVALGDSVAAGVGLKNYSDSTACDRTEESYPKVLARLEPLTVLNLACTGATIAAGINDKQNVNELLVTAQLGQLFQVAKPDFVSLTIGANDIDWTEVITKCYVGNCGTPEDTAILSQRLATFTSELRAVFTTIQAQYSKDLPMVFTTGYYQVFPVAAQATCSDVEGITHTELTWWHQQEARLNQAIKAVVQEFAFASYVAVDFSSHELCTDDAWVQGITATTPYHPTVAGQQAIARALQAAIHKESKE